MKKLFTVVSVVMLFCVGLVMPVKVFAECTGVLEFLAGTPLEKFACQSVDTDPADRILSLIQAGITIFFVLVLIVAVIYTLIAAVKYIRSEGNEQKVEGAKNAIKAVLMGVAAIFIALIALVIINSVFIGDSSLKEAIRNLINAITGNAS